MIDSAQVLIDALGGYMRVAEAIGRPIGTVASWKHRNAIPAEEWASFIKLADAKRVEGVTPDLLLRLFPQRETELKLDALRVVQSLSTGA